jgi:hypothetical protein
MARGGGCTHAPREPLVIQLILISLHSFDYGDIHFVVLDSSQSQYGPMLTWLRKDLLAVNSPLLAHFNATGELQPHVPARHRRPRSRNPKWLIAIVHAAPYSKVWELRALSDALVAVHGNSRPMKQCFA